MPNNPVLVLQGDQLQQDGSGMAETRELTLVIDSDIDDELTAIAESTGRDKPSLAREALLEWLEDQADIKEAKTIIAQGKPSIPLAEVKRSLGLAS
jgi:RHH-type rel operon transcriptional repressor/antitoxin RelB